jgi:hypothetical protein
VKNDSFRAFGPQENKPKQSQFFSGGFPAQVQRATLGKLPF